jgi:hypothetical protein
MVIFSERKYGRMPRRSAQGCGVETKYGCGRLIGDVRFCLRGRERLGSLGLGCVRRRQVRWVRPPALHLDSSGADSSPWMEPSARCSHAALRRSPPATLKVGLEGRWRYCLAQSFLEVM